MAMSTKINWRDKVNYTYSVDVVDRKTRKVVKSSEVVGMAQAARLKKGIEVNLNKERYFVSITKQD